MLKTTMTWVRMGRIQSRLGREKIDKPERQILGGKLMFVDDDGKPLHKANSMVNADSDSEVEEVFNKTAGYMASTSLKSGSAVVMVICDDFDITVRGRKKNVC
ncbi:hypothetical protein Tco_0276772 [Tanacetum coccineum]